MFVIEDPAVRKHGDTSALSSAPGEQHRGQSRLLAHVYKVKREAGDAEARRGYTQLRGLSPQESRTCRETGGA